MFYFVFLFAVTTSYYVKLTNLQALIDLLNCFQAGENGKIACISSPSVYVKIKNDFPNAKGEIKFCL